jgi:hypothetical protein
LTADIRARLGEMKVAPVAAEAVANDTLLPRDIELPTGSLPKRVPSRAKRVEAD